MGPTVFIIGAGASCDFKNFPIGNELARKIDSQLSAEISNRGGPIASALSSNGGLIDAHFATMARITSGIHSRDSIDQFVDDCRGEPMVAEIAKLAISQAILSAESSSELRVDNRRPPEVILRTMRDTWLGHICRYANGESSRQDFLGAIRDISFVTFNYDRAIERFLLLWVQATLRVNYEHAAQLVSQIPILHVFGQVGYLPSLSADKASTIVFGDATGRSIFRGAQGIKTFTEEIDSVHGQTVQELLTTAQTLVFLGFQFHQQNMNILFRSGWPRGVNAYATAYGVGDRRLDRIVQRFGDSGCRATIEQQQCWPFMQTHGEEIFDD